ncbi:hypothetical protein LXL04_015830 [Taraxacum kok-saghyz]
MKENISEKLEKYFFNLQYNDYDKADKKLIQLMSLETEECEELYQKEPQLFDQYFRMNKKINLYEQVTTVTNVPESESSKTKAIPVQTAPGKESTNPLKAEVLLKSLIKETTTPLPNGKTSLLVNSNPCTEGISKMTTLSPTNKTVQELKPDYRKALDKAAERYYVIYQGPHAGIHTDWGTTEAFCKVDKVTCRKFPSEISARLSIALHQEASKAKTPLLRPKIQRAKEDHRDQCFEVPQDIKHQVSHPSLSLEDFRAVWNKARVACPEDLIHERFYTTDKKTKSLYNFIEGADPNLVYQAYSAGLIDNIYPSCNLQKLKFFPSSLVEAIKNFRRKRDIEQSQPMEDKDLPFPEILHPIRISGLRRIPEKINEIISGSKKKVNYTTSHCIVVSWSFKSTGNEDLELASRFGMQFQNNSLEASSATRQSFCRHAEQLFEDNHCTYCVSNDVKEETNEGPTTEETSSSE